MLRARMRRRIREKERVDSFRGELAQLYKNFKSEIEILCKKYGAKINCWYSPSMIPQPKFVINGVTFDADDLYYAEEIFKGKNLRE